MAISRLSTSRVTQGLPKFQSAWDQDNVATGSLIPIANAAHGSANFSNIPQDYKHLYICGVLRGTNAGTIEYGNITLNGSSSNIYSYTGYTTDGSTTVSNRNTPVSMGAFYLGLIPGGTATNDLFASYEIWIPNYSNTSYTKTLLWRLSGDTGATGGVTYFGTGQFFQNAAVTSLNVFGSNGSAPGTRHNLYGIRG